MTSELIDVLVPIPVLEKFSYLPVKGSRVLPKPGSRVLIPFGRRTLVGVVWKISKLDKSDKRKYKHIKEILDDSPLLDTHALKLAEWSSRYYHYPLGEIISYFFPPSLRKGEEAKFRQAKYLELTSRGEFLDMKSLENAPAQKKLITLLQEKHEVSITSLKAFGISSASVKSLINKGFIRSFSRELSPYKQLDDKKSLSPKKLNKEQSLAVSKIKAAQDKNMTFLLDGITGSGKTEVCLLYTSDAADE